MKKHLKQLFKADDAVLSLVYGNLMVNPKNFQKKGYSILKNSYRMFFVEVIPVPPNRFRPENKMNDQTFLHQHTVALTKILQLN